LFTYWGFIFSAYVRQGDEGYGQIESCGEVEEDTPHPPPPGGVVFDVVKKKEKKKDREIKR